MTSTHSSDVDAVTEALGTSAPVTGLALPSGRSGIPPWLSGTIGALVLIGVWEILAVTAFHKPGSGVPTPTAVASKLWSDYRHGLYGVNFRQTMKEAATGYLGANALAIVLAVTFVQVRIIEKALLRIAIASYCLPIIAIAPILTFVLHGDAPKAVLAGLLCFFPTLVGCLVGLRSADQTTLDLIRAAGGGSWAQLTKVRLRSALPSVFAALQIAAPSAILGAIIGEYLGRQDHGLGILMVNAQGELLFARTWGIAVVCTGVAGLLFALTGLIGRALTPWAPRRSAAG